MSKGIQGLYEMAESIRRAWRHGISWRLKVWRS
jgi:hypothetical protein